jgi:hypothetical protein
MYCALCVCVRERDKKVGENVNRNREVGFCELMIQDQ